VLHKLHLECYKLKKIIRIETNQVFPIELETLLILFPKLINTIQPLEEHWRFLVFVSVKDTASVGEFVAKFKPLPLHKGFKSFECPIVGIRYEHTEGNYLGGTIPAIRTMDEDGYAYYFASFGANLKNKNTFFAEGI
jgi:hypothetical protein